MPKNTDKDSSKSPPSKGEFVTLNPVTGNVTIDNVDSQDIVGVATSDSSKKLYANDVTTTYRSGTFGFKFPDYDARFENKKEALVDIIEDGGELTREDVADIVKTGNLALAQHEDDE